MMVAARSSKLQRVAGWSCASVLLLARVRTCSRSSGGKAPGSPGARGILEARETVSDEAFAPLADGVPVAIQLLRELLVGGVVGDGSVKDETAAEGQGLRRRASTGQCLELLPEF